MFGKRSLRKVEWALVLVLSLAGSMTSAWAQLKVTAKVNPNPEGTTNPIKFDVNAEPTDNVSPNIYVTPDGERGFVPYTGSGVILEFSMITGEILNRIETGGKPFYATPLASGDQLAIVSVFDNRVFIINTDVGASRLEATYAFSKAQFGFGSIITLSPDGTVGWVSSTGTGEVIKFNVNDGSEIGRIRGMRYPAQITATPDGNTVMVVDTDLGTPEVSFFNTTTLTKKGSLTNPDSTNLVVLFTIFNKPVLAPDGKTGIIASRGHNNISYGEVVFYFNADNGSILKVGNTGPAPGWTGLTPDGKFWVVLNMFSVTIFSTNDFEQTVEFQAPSGEPIGSANVVFSPDSRYAYYAAPNLSSFASLRDKILQMDLSDGAFVEQIQVGDNPDYNLDQPAGMAITPDGKNLAVLEFASGYIDLMTPVTMRAACKYVSSADTFSGLSLLNLSSKTNTVTVYAMTDFGETLAETGTTNPVVFTLEPNEQVSMTVAELFNLDDSTAPEEGRTGWIAIYSDEPEITGYLSIGKKDFTGLNGFSLESGRLHDFILPQIDRLGDAQVQFNPLNATYYTASYELTRIAHDGTAIDVLQNQYIGGNNRETRDMPDLFPRTEVEREGYLWGTSPEGISFSEFANNGISVDGIKAIDRTKFAGITRIYSPQFATVPGWKTTLNVINANQEEADVTVTFHRQDGTVLWQFQKHFNIGEQLLSDVAELYQNPPDGVTDLVSDPEVLSTVGWIDVESTKDEILGIVTFHADDNRFAASYEFQATPLEQILFPVVSQNAEYQTGVALLNPDSEPARVVLELWGTDGTKLKENTITLDPQSRTAVYLNSLFPDMDPLLVGNLRIRSDKALYSFSLMHNTALSFLMPMAAQPLF